MKQNNKGFMLVEVIITSTVVITAMIGLYSSFNKLYNNYQTKNNYYNIDGVYATKIVINELLNNDFNTYLNENNSNSSYSYLIKKDNNRIACGDKCSDIRDLYKVENMILVEYSSEALNNLKNIVSNQTFKEYINYTINYYNFNDENYNYIILTEIKDGNNYYYANLRMR